MECVDHYPRLLRVAEATKEHIKFNYPVSQPPINKRGKL